MDECSIPVAKVANPVNPAAGNTISLDGCGSSAGTCGGAVYTNGFLWFILEKPEGSSAYLNAETSCNTSFVPDVAGDYTVGLIVYDEQNFYQSEMVSVTIPVAE